MTFTANNIGQNKMHYIRDDAAHRRRQQFKNYMN
jgi:hypothetical protein